MRIKTVAIHNFRSIAHLQFHCQPLTVFVGPNNHGKSNIIASMEFALLPGAKVDASDFFCHRPSTDPDLWVEITFDALTDQEKITFRKYVHPAGLFKMRKTARIIQEERIEITYNGYVVQPCGWWLQSTNVDQLTNRDKLKELNKDIPGIGVLLSVKGGVTKKLAEEWQISYIDDHRNDLDFQESMEEGPLFGQKNVAAGVLPDFHIVPAVKELSDETRIRTTTALGRLLQRCVQDMARNDDRFSSVIEQVKRAVEQLNSQADSDRPDGLVELEAAITEELAGWGVTISLEVRAPDIDKLFELGTTLQVDDGVRTSADRKGHGLQRAILFALLRAWCKAIRKPVTDKSDVGPRKSSDSLFFAIEEPELFLHPHAQRKLANVLRDIASTSGHQVFISTHSTQFIDLGEYRGVKVVSKLTNMEGTLIRQCVEDIFEGDNEKVRKNTFKLISSINPDRGELFFARKVVLVEGATEKALIPFLAEKLKCLDLDVTVVDCQGKSNLEIYILLLKAFSIPYLVIHDEDPVPQNCAPDKLAEAQRLFECNEVLRSMVEPPLGKVTVLRPDLEGVAGVSKSKMKQKGKPLAAVEHFATMPIDEVPAVLREMIMEGYGQ